MMNRIEQKSSWLKKNRKKACIAYITAGFPNLKTTKTAVKILEENGVDIIELGMPFSDPIADGPTIQYASGVALKNGMNMHVFFDLVGELRKTTQIPLVIMSYYNPIFKFGVKRFALEAAKSGLDGVIVPDLPPEEAVELNDQLRARGISEIFLVSPVTAAERVKKIVSAASGFVYYVSLTGVTGARNVVPSGVIGQVQAIKRLTTLPVYVGFGVSTAGQAKSIVKTADGIIVGSAIIKLIERYHSSRLFAKKLGAYINSLSRVMPY
ncbi:MAG: tryptophan synthase subunit alpha [Candidatus Omnitrophica bacterium]|nr:tryptophan synthase subunit alpha [Candidatus Omnitrophota bacterium]MBU4479475.1 tryptophan synthase subunit alpha [Candidatus Omnitrophota bacterium]